jgi:predicted nuclease with TOPRIM domain
MDSPLNQIIVTIVTALGSAGAWQFYQNRMKVKSLQRKQDKDDKNLYRDDLRERVAILEQRLEQAYQEKEKTSQELAVVMSQMAEYKVRIEFLEKENDRLQSTR